VQPHLHPTRCLFDGLSWVVGSPTFYETQPQQTKSPQIIYTYGRRRVAHTVRRPCSTRNRGDLCGGGCLRRLGLLLHLFTAHTQIENFDVSLWVNFVDGITRWATSLPVEIITRDEYTLFTEASNPNVALATTNKLYTTPCESDEVGFLFKQNMPCWF